MLRSKILQSFTFNTTRRMSAQPDLLLYTNHACPFAQRAHIALKELKLSFSEEIIPLSPPKPKEYLFINPRGTVPTLKFNQEIITESAIVAQFLADAFPPALVPKNNGPQTALQRARVAFFVDTYMSKPQAQVMKAIFTSDKDVVRNSIDGAIRDFSEHIEPLLADANPFFAGSKDLTLVEVLTGSFVIRLFSYCKHGFLPADVPAQIERKAPNFYKWAHAVISHESISSTFPEEMVVESTKKLRAREQQKA